MNNEIFDIKVFENLIYAIIYIFFILLLLDRF